jgi:RimJ/RimL family protein N-acetyltransferase
MLTVQEKEHLNHVRLESDRLLLVSYGPQHVLRYMSWVEASDHLRRDTGTDVILTRAENEELQRRWEKDLDKFLFIILDKNKYHHLMLSVWDQGLTRKGDDIESLCMIGDVGARFLPLDEDNEIDNEMSTTEFAYELEIDMMIADGAYRGKGLAFEACQLFIEKTSQILSISNTMGSCRKRFIVKIKRWNIASIALFRKLGFQKYKTLDVFEEVWLAK